MGAQAILAQAVWRELSRRKLSCQLAPKFELGTTLATMSSLRACTAVVILLSGADGRPRRRSEVLGRDAAEAMGVVWRGNSSNSHDLLSAPLDLPADFTWCDKDGV